MARASVESRQEEILQAALTVVADLGFAATRIGDVAKLLGISTGLVHYHFSSKHHLMAEAFRYAAERELEELRDELGSAASSTDNLAVLLDQVTSPIPDASWNCWIDGWSEALRSEPFREISRELDQAWTTELRQVIEVGVAHGHFRCADPRGAAWRLAGLCDGLAIQPVAHHGADVAAAELKTWLRQAADHELGISGAD